MPAASTVTSGSSPVLAACPAHLAPRARLMTGMETSLPHRMTPGMCGKKKVEKWQEATMRVRFRPIPATGIFRVLTAVRCQAFELTLS